MSVVGNLSSLSAIGAGIINGESTTEIDDLDRLDRERKSYPSRNLGDRRNFELDRTWTEHEVGVGNGCYQQPLILDLHCLFGSESIKSSVKAA